MHERKALMASLSDGFVACPVAGKVLDEFFEVLTWAQLGLHRKRLRRMEPATNTSMEAISAPLEATVPLLPEADAARIRAFFVAPEHARRGIGRLILATCAQAAQDGGFSRLELMATLPGVPFYQAMGFEPVGPVTNVLPMARRSDFLQMTRPLESGRA